MNASRTREGLDWLFARYPFYDLVSLEWQYEPAADGEAARWAGPWILVELGQPSATFEAVPSWAVWRFAIWRATGAVYMVGADGAVPDDPIYDPSA